VLNGTLPEFRLESRFVDPLFYGKGILFAEKDTMMPDTSGWAIRSVCDIPAAGEKIKKGSPVCTIKSRRNTYDEILAELIRQANVLKEEIYG